MSHGAVMTTYEQRALENLEYAQGARADLRRAYAFQPLDYELIGRLKADQRYHLDVAQVYAGLAAAQILRELERPILPSYGGGVLP